MKTKLLAVCLLGFIVLTGCKEPPEVVEVDPETQRELAEFARQLDEKTASYAIASRETNVVTATTDTTEASPAESSRTTPEVSPDKALAEQATGNNTEVSVPDFDISDKEMISSMIDESLSANFGESKQAETAFTPEHSGVRNPGTANRNVAGNSDSNVGEQNVGTSAPAVGHSSNQNPPDQNRSTENVTAPRLSKSSTPEEVCKAFLGALANSDHVAANQMLTNIAQIETARAKLELESPGGPGARFEVMPARFATSAREIAQVLCLLHQPESADPVRLTWMMRSQYNGWKISGISIQLTEGGPEDLLSFENARDLKRIQNTVDDSEPQDSTRTAQKNTENETSDR